MTSKSRVFWPTIAVVVIADIITKSLAEKHLTFHVPHEVIGDFLRFTLSYNTGAAFGISLFGGSRWVYVALTAFILTILWRMLKEAEPADRTQALALGLIVGGALGNLYDRLRWTKGVVDFIDVGIGSSRFWTFNIADSGISVGASLMVLLFILRSREKHHEVVESAEDGAAGNP